MEKISTAEINLFFFPQNEYVQSADVKNLKKM